MSCAVEQMTIPRVMRSVPPIATQRRPIRSESALTNLQTAASASRYPRTSQIPTINATNVDVDFGRYSMLSLPVLILGNPDWSRYYSKSEDIWQYMKDWAGQSELEKHVSFSHTVRERKCMDSDGVWKVKVERPDGTKSSLKH